MTDSKSISRKRHCLNLGFGLIFLFSWNSLYAQSETFSGIKCVDFFSQLDQHYKQVKNNSNEKFDIYSRIKLIVPSLENLKDSQELSSIQISEIENYKKELLILGLQSEVIKKTRLERFEIGGKNIDVFAFFDGSVHHISNPFNDYTNKPLLSMSECKISKVNLLCIDSKNEKIKQAFCEF
jgi:hypothetical protein